MGVDRNWGWFILGGLLLPVAPVLGVAAIGHGVRRSVGEAINPEEFTEEAFQDVLKAERKCPGEPVDIFGASRGAVMAIVLSNRLLGAGITARFLGLIDPVATGVIDPPSNILRGPRAWLGIKTNAFNVPWRTWDNLVKTWYVGGYSVELAYAAYHTDLMSKLTLKGLEAMTDLKADAKGAGVAWDT